MTRLNYLPPAKADVASAVQWLHAVRTGLGRSFIERLDEIGERLILFPQSGSPIPGSPSGCRRVILRTFDYALVYRLLSGESNSSDHTTIEVVAVLHCRLDPRRAIERMEYPSTTVGPA